MTAHERRKEIQRLLRVNERMTVAEMSQRFGISEVSIRKDLRLLEQQGNIVRGHGTASAQGSYNLRLDMQTREDEKRRIAAQAAALVGPGDVVLLGPGSTTCMLGQALSAREDVLLVTNAVSFEPYLTACKAKLLYLGGEYTPANGSVSGAFAIDTLSTLRIDKLFLGTTGVTAAGGITSNNFSDTLMARTMIERSRQMILLADHTKFGEVSAIRIADLQAAHTVITNRELAPSNAAEIESLGVNLILA